MRLRTIYICAVMVLLLQTGACMNNDRWIELMLSSRGDAILPVMKLYGTSVSDGIVDISIKDLYTGNVIYSSSRPVYKYRFVSFTYSFSRIPYENLSMDRSILNDPSKVKWINVDVKFYHNDDQTEYHADKSITFM